MSQAFPQRTTLLDEAISQVDAQLSMLTRHPKPFWVIEGGQTVTAEQYLNMLLDMRRKLKHERQAEDEPYMRFERPCRPPWGGW